METEHKTIAREGFCSRNRRCIRLGKVAKNPENHRLVTGFLRGHWAGKTPKNIFLENLAVDLSENPKIIEKVLVRKENEYFEVSPKCRLLFFKQIFQI